MNPENNHLNEFKEAVKSGALPDKNYFYKRTEEELQAQTEEMSVLVDYFKSRFDIVLSPTYGTLLGMVRENNFIMHDNDVDFTYLSRFNNQFDALNEFCQIAGVLNNDGLLCKVCMAGQIHFFGPSKQFIYDLWSSFICNNKYYLIPLFCKGIDSNLILPFKSQEFRKVILPIPNEPEKLLDIMYVNWREPVTNHFLKDKTIYIKWQSHSLKEMK